MTDLCSKLYRDFDHEGWNEFDLETLPNRELEFLSRMMGIAFSGTKSARIVRLLSCRIVRRELSKFEANPDGVKALTEQFKRSRLRWMCDQAHVWKSGNKLQLAVCLLNWRNRCRREGNAYYQRCVEQSLQEPQQLTLALT